jgi:hypothetical protein
MIFIEEIVRLVEQYYHKSTQKLIHNDIALYKAMLEKYSTHGNINISKEEFNRAMLESTTDQCLNKQFHRLLKSKLG